MLVAAPDGRQLDVRASGPADGSVLVFHHGTPGAAVPYGALVRAAVKHGMRLVTVARPGYGASSRRAGRLVVDIADDLERVLDHLGLGEAPLTVAGWSGGGPHALATAAALGDRVRSTVLIASVARCGESGMRPGEWLAGMGEDNLAEFDCAARGESTLRPFLEDQAAGMRDADAGLLLSSMASLLPPVDRAALTQEFGADLAGSFSEGLRHGVNGWVDDDLAFLMPWGFELAEVVAPVFVWQGSEDLMVPFAHGEWLSANLPTAVAHLETGQGHLSLAVGALDRMLDEAVAVVRAG